MFNCMTILPDERVGCMDNNKILHVSHLFVSDVRAGR